MSFKEDDTGLPIKGYFLVGYYTVKIATGDFTSARVLTHEGFPGSFYSSSLSHLSSDGSLWVPESRGDVWYKSVPTDDVGLSALSYTYPIYIYTILVASWHSPSWVVQIFIYF